MGKAGKALKQGLETYGISQNRIAVVMEVGRSVVLQKLLPGVKDI
jgi:predicted XRE-type DNA-binding protein